MQFYLFSLIAISLDFLICYFFIKWARYDLKESLVTLVFYVSDIWFVLIARESSGWIGDLSRSIWSLKYDFLNGIEAFLYQQKFAAYLEPSILSYVILFVLTDFSYYWIHRMNHEIGLIWTQHAVHHSPTKLNYLATQRNSFRFTTITYQQIFFIVPMFYFPLEKVLFAFAVIQCHQTLIHSEWIPRFPRIFEWILNSPYHHRIHHSIEMAPKNGNYGGILIVFDRIFGTVVEVPDRRFTYGVPGRMVTHNVIKLNFQYLWELCLRAKASGSISKALVLIFLPNSISPRRNVES